MFSKFIYIRKDIIEALGRLFNISMNSFLLIVFSSISIYVAIIILTRIFGKWSFSKMSSFNFAMTVAVGSIMATTILSESVHFLKGTIGLIMIYTIQLLAAYFRRYNWFRKLTDNQPTLIMEGGKILKDNMKAARITEGDLRSKLREANVTKLSEIKAVIFETTGNIVVLHNDKNDEIDEWLLNDVQR